jgi:hypothetical protein
MTRGPQFGSATACGQFAGINPHHRIQARPAFLTFMRGRLSGQNSTGQKILTGDNTTTAEVLGNRIAFGTSPFGTSPFGTSPKSRDS